MKKYLTFFRITFINGLQYRAAALGGMLTQFFWGGFNILLYFTLYGENRAAFPMELSALVSYMWLRQAFLALLAPFFMNGRISGMIQSGQVGVELCRPADLYWMWFADSLASRVVRAALRCGPILVVAALLPRPYGIAPPPSLLQFLLFALSLAVATVVVVAFLQLVTVSLFYTVSSRGPMIIATVLADFLSGNYIPLPFLPEPLYKALSLLPFAGMVDTPLRIYSGAIAGESAVFALLLQLFWAVALTALGKAAMGRALKKTVVHGG